MWWDRDSDIECKKVARILMIMIWLTNIFPLDNFAANLKDALTIIFLNRIKILVSMLIYERKNTIQDQIQCVWFRSVHHDQRIQESDWD